MARHREDGKRRAWRSAICALLLTSALLSGQAAIAGPVEDVEARAAAIQGLLDAGKPVDGEAIARQALGFAEAELGPQAAGTANIYRLFGDTLFDQQRYAEAEPLFRKALAIRERALGPDHPDSARSNGDLAVTLKSLKRFDEAEQLYRRALTIREKAFGPDSGDVAQSWFRLSRLFDAKGEYAKAAEMLEHAVAVGEKAYGAEHRTVILWTGEEAAQLHDSGDVARAEPLYRHAIAGGEAGFPTDDLDLANFRQGLANLLRQSNRPGEAEPLYRAVLAAREKALASQDPRLAATLEGLGRSLEMLDRFAEAVGPYRRALAIREQANGAENEAAAEDITRLGIVLMRLDQAADAEPLLRRLLAMREAAQGADGEGVAEALRWIANAAEHQDRNAEAEILHKRALAISEKRYGPDGLLTGHDLLSLGLLYAGQQRVEEAEPLLTRAVAIMESTAGGSESAVAARIALAFMKFASGEQDEAVALTERSLADVSAVKGADHLDAADLMVTLAQMRLELGAYAEAERLAIAAQAIYSGKAPESRQLIRTKTILGSVRLAERRTREAIDLYSDVLTALQQRFGADSGEIQSALADIGRAHFVAGEFREAAADLERSVALTERVAAIDAATAFANRTGRIEDHAVARAAVFDFLVKAYDRIGEASPDERGALSQKAFLVAQRVIESQAAAALSKMALRQAAGTGELAVLVRERQDLVDDWQRQDRKLTDMQSATARDGAEEQAVLQKLDSADRRIKAIDARLKTGFPDFAALQQPSALTYAGVQAALADDEVLLFYADTGQLGEAGFETYLWAVPKQGEPRWLRLERSTGELSGGVRRLRALIGVGQQARGAQTLAAGTKSDRTGEVLEAAKELHDALLLPVADMIAGKSLVVVPSRKLSSLPFQLLVSSTPTASAERYRDARWLIRDHAITVLPSVASLAALKPVVASNDAREPYFGFANPLLTGRSGEDRRALARDGCKPAAASAMLVAAAADLPDAASFFRGATADIAAVRSLEPLPETVDEVCATAAALGAGDDALRLGADATEVEVKRLSEQARLSSVRILHFATHGLISGDLSGLAEPAIVLTPPDHPGEADDGLLTASEVTTLKLDADWVILSACNTASGDGGGEALSGLARAFFYAGARALMVSHWPVNSDAAVSLATGAIAAAVSDPAIDRAEALRRAMLAEIDKGGRHAEPANWAPFVLVGAAR